MSQKNHTKIKKSYVNISNFVGNAVNDVFRFTVNKDINFIDETSLTYDKNNTYETLYMIDPEVRDSTKLKSDMFLK